MSNHKLDLQEDVLIGREYWDVPLCIQLPAYLRFSNQMDVQLRRLVACWIYAAAPIARGKSSMSSEKRLRRR